MHICRRVSDGKDERKPRFAAFCKKDTRRGYGRPRLECVGHGAQKKKKKKEFFFFFLSLVVQAGLTDN